MAKSKGQPKAHGHSGGAFGHGGHHKKDNIYSHDHSDHMTGSGHTEETSTAGMIGGE